MGKKKKIRSAQQHINELSDMTMAQMAAKNQGHVETDFFKTIRKVLEIQQEAIDQLLNEEGSFGAVTRKREKPKDSKKVAKLFSFSQVTTYFSESP